MVDEQGAGNAQGLLKMKRLALVLCLLSPACGNPTKPDASSPSSSATASDLAACVQDINNDRARAGRGPYAESTALEAFAATGAQQDAASGTAHGHFLGVNGGGVALAENEYLREPSGSSIQTAIQIADAIFFAEGPGGGHYENLTSAAYTQAGCGIVVVNGAITIVEDFR